MQDKQEQPNIRPGYSQSPTTPIIEYQNLAKVQIVQVLKQDLESLGTMSDEEGLSSNFFGLSLGTFISCALSWLGIDHTRVLVVAILAALTAVSLASSIFMGITFRRQRKARQAKQQELLKSQL